MEHRDVSGTDHLRAHQEASCFHYLYYSFHCEAVFGLLRTSYIGNALALIEGPLRTQPYRASPVRNSEWDPNCSTLAISMHQSFSVVRARGKTLDPKNFVGMRSTSSVGVIDLLQPFRALSLDRIAKHIATIWYRAEQQQIMLVDSESE